MNALSTKSCRPANTLRNHPAETNTIGQRIVGLNTILVRLINRTEEQTHLNGRKLTLQVHVL